MVSGTDKTLVFEQKTVFADSKGISFSGFDGYPDRDNDEGSDVETGDRRVLQSPFLWAGCG